MDEIITNGCIFMEYEEDYKFGSSQTLLDIMGMPEIESQTFEYNQNEFARDYGYCLCTAYGPLGCYSDIFKKNIIQSDRLKLVKYRTKLKDFDPKVGGYLVEGVKAVCDIQKDCLFYRLPKQSIKTLLNKGYAINIGLYDGGDIAKAREDGKMTSDEIMKIVNANLGHSTKIVDNGLYYRVNSYSGVLKNNRVEIEDLDKFINSWFVYQNAYVLIPNIKIKEYFENLLKNKSYKQAFDYYFKLSETLYKKEKMILQYVLQMKYVGKINNKELLDLKF